MGEAFGAALALVPAVRLPPRVAGALGDSPKNESIWLSGFAVGAGALDAEAVDTDALSDGAEDSTGAADDSEPCEATASDITLP